MLEVIRKAHRFPNGRIEGVGPPQLIPRVLRMMTLSEQLKLYAIEAKRRAIQRESMEFLASLGLNPKGQYVFHKTGAVTERGRWRPRYD